MIGPTLKREIEAVFHVVRDKSSPDELVFLCPECNDRSGHRSVNLRTGVTFCWRCNKGANNKGRFVAWARALGFEFSKDDYNSVPIERLFDEEPSKSDLPVIKEVNLPRGFTAMAREPDDVYTRLITKMAKRKHLGHDDFADAGVGFTRTTPKWEPFAIFPVYEYKVPVYYQGRTYVDVPGETTKRFPSRIEVPLGASYWIYNIDAVRKQLPKRVVIVESILNVLSLKRKFAEEGMTDIVAVSVFKHYISKIQATKLLQCEGVKQFYLLFDHDAIDQTWKMMEQLGNRIPVRVAEMPYEEGNKKLDANDDVEAALVAIDEAVPYKMGTAYAHRFENEPKAMSERKVDLTTKRIRS